MIPYSQNISNYNPLLLTYRKIEVAYHITAVEIVGPIPNQSQPLGYLVQS